MNEEAKAAALAAAVEMSKISRPIPEYLTAELVTTDEGSYVELRDREGVLFMCMHPVDYEALKAWK